MIRLQCECGRKIAAPDQWLGKRVKCPQCGRPVLVAPPGAAPAQSAPLQAAPAHPAPAPREPVEQSAPQTEPVVLGRSSAEEDEAPISSRVAVASSSRVDEQDEQSPEIPEPSAQVSAPSIEPVRPSAATAPQVRFEPPQSPTVPSPEKTADLPPGEDDESEFYEKQKRLPRVLGTLGLLIAVAAGAACWVPQLDQVTLYIALGGVAISTIGFGLSMSRYRLGLAMPVIGLVASLLAMAMPYVLPAFPRIAPVRYVQRADQAKEHEAEVEAESQRRGLLSVESLRLTGAKDSLAPEVAYKLINRSGKTIKQITGSIQLIDRDHRALGGLALNLSGPYEPNEVIEGKNEWTMEDATQSAIADNHFTADYRADQVVYSDGSTKSYNKP